MSSFIEVKAGSLSLSQRKTIYGIGINDADYIIKSVIGGKRKMCPYYSTWREMLRRCYSPKLQKIYQTYIGCTVAEEWLTFTNFKGWMIRQDWEGKDLDKDIKVIGNKIYSPNTCLFVSQKINKLLTDHGASRGNWPIGVCLYKRGGKFSAHCRRNGKLKYLGSFTTPESAHEEWRAYKRKVIIEAANSPENNYIKAYLLERANNL